MDYIERTLRLKEERLKRASKQVSSLYRQRIEEDISEGTILTIGNKEVKLLDPNSNELGEKITHNNNTIYFNQKDGKIYIEFEGLFFDYGEIFSEARNPLAFTESCINEETHPFSLEVKEYSELDKIKEIIEKEEEKGYHQAYDPEITGGNVILLNPKQKKVRMVSKNGVITPLSTKEEIEKELSTQKPDCGICERWVMGGIVSRDTNVGGIPEEDPEMDLIMESLCRNLR